MIPTYKTEDEHFGGVLACPRCGSGETHHEEQPVEVWQRRQDEQGYGCAIYPDGRSGPIPPDDNPSMRRSGLRVNFLCGYCHEPFALTVAQHKGDTYINVEVP